LDRTETIRDKYIRFHVITRRGQRWTRKPVRIIENGRYLYAKRYDHVQSGVRAGLTRFVAGRTPVGARVFRTDRFHGEHLAEHSGPRARLQQRRLVFVQHVIPPVAAHRQTTRTRVIFTSSTAADPRTFVVSDGIRIFRFRRVYARGLYECNHRRFSSYSAAVSFPTEFSNLRYPPSSWTLRENLDVSIRSTNTKKSSENLAR